MVHAWNRHGPDAAERAGGPQTDRRTALGRALDRCYPSLWIPSMKRCAPVWTWAALASSVSISMAGSLRINFIRSAMVRKIRCTAPGSDTMTD